MVCARRKPQGGPVMYVDDKTSTTEQGNDDTTLNLKSQTQSS